MSRTVTQEHSSSSFDSASEYRDEAESLDLLYPDNLVTLSDHDPQNPLSWTTRRKILYTVLFGFCAFNAQFGGTVMSPTVEALSEEFHVGTELGVLNIALYVLGMSLGPILFAPLSEVYGRKMGVFVPAFISSVFMCISANVNSLPALLVLRFIAGVFASATMVSSGGAMADMWAAEQRAAALILYGTCTIAGTYVAPILGALILDHGGASSWRWTCWLGGLLELIVSAGNYIFLSETYRPVLAMRKAKLLRIQTGNWALHAKHEEWKFDANEFFRVHMARPVLMFATPIVFFITVYASFVYGVLFLISTSVGDNFQKIKGFGRTASYLPLLSSVLGYAAAALPVVMNSRYYAQKITTGKPVVPEDRLLSMMAFSWTFPAGIFIYAWTLDEHIHWFVPCVGLFMVGWGFAVVNQGSLSYLIDVYTRYGTSALSAYSQLRSILGGVFPLVANQMYNKLGVHWAGSLIGFCGLAMLPIPYILYTFGARVRARNPYAEHLS